MTESGDFEASYDLTYGGAEATVHEGSVDETDQTYG